VEKGQESTCETSSGSRPQEHRSYESVRRHLFLQTPTMALGTAETIQQRPLMSRDVNTEMPKRNTTQTNLDKCSGKTKPTNHDANSCSYC